MITQALILAGGRGTRLGELAEHTPKPLLPVAGRPFLEYIIWNLRRHGITRIVLSVGYRAQQISDHFGDGARFGARITYIVEQEPAGTGGPLHLARDQLDDAFLVLNGDTLFDINYRDLELLSIRHRDASACLALRHVPDTGAYGRIALEGHRIGSFNEKSEGGPGWINGGVYVVRKSLIDAVGDLPCSLEQEVFPHQAERGTLAGKRYEGFFLDMGTPASLQRGHTEMAEWQRFPAVFLDRDGVINEDSGYVCAPEDFAWVEGAPEAIKDLNDRGYLVFVVTNQAGIARGYYSEDDFHEFTRWLSERLAERGAHLDATLYCPHHPDVEHPRYGIACDCRKPKPGMLLEALRTWPVDQARCLLVGDKESDIQAAEAIGMRGVRFEGGNLMTFLGPLLP